MNQEIKERWLARLRSGQYAQGTGLLAAQGDGGEFRYCCLGVLCEIAVEDGIIGKKLRTVDQDSGQRAYAFGTHLETLDPSTSIYAPEPEGPTAHSSTLLPTAVVAWAGLSAVDPEVAVQEEGHRDGDDHYPAGQDPLSQCNDDRRYDFNRIADLIEASL